MIQAVFLKDHFGIFVRKSSYGRQDWKEGDWSGGYCYSPGKGVRTVAWANAEVIEIVKSGWFRKYFEDNAGSSM